jgi:magnesium chelatase subunit D
VTADAGAQPAAADSLRAAPQEVFQTGDGRWWEGGQRSGLPQTALTPQPLTTPQDARTRRQSGRRSQTLTDRKSGRYIRAQVPHGKLTDLAFDATVRAAAPYQRERRTHAPADAPALILKPHDLREKVRVRKAANLILFVVDASWSMAVAERMAATKGAIFSLLTDAYQHRDRVGLIVFQKNRATLVLPPTHSVDLASRALQNIPIGGKTPLSAGLLLAYEVLRREKIAHPDVRPLLIVLTDGAANVSIDPNVPPLEEAYALADQIAAEGIRSLVLNMEVAEFDQGYARTLAEHLKAPCRTLADLRAETLYTTVRAALD